MCNYHDHNQYRDCNVKSDPGICAACAKVGTTCCYIEPDKAELCFPLSRPEAKRLREYVGKELHLGEAPNSLEFLNVMKNLFPAEDTTVSKIFPLGGNHLTLAVNNGFCVHLGERGCVLPRVVRPWFCRIFPFWVDRGNLTGFAAPYCLAQRQTITVRGLLNCMGQSEVGVFEIYNRLRFDWGFVPYVPGVVPAAE